MKSFLLSLKLILLASSLFAQVSYLGPEEPSTTDQEIYRKYFYFADSNNTLYKISNSWWPSDSLYIFKNVANKWVDVADDTLRKYSLGVYRFKVQVAQNGIIYLMLNPTLPDDRRIVLLRYQNNTWARVPNINIERSDISIELFKVWNNDPIICTMSFDSLYVYKYNQNQLTELVNYYLDNGVSPSISFQNNYILLSYIDNDQLNVKKYQNGTWSDIKHSIQINSLNDYFIHIRSIELSQKTVLVVYGFFDFYYKLLLLSYSNNNLSSDSLELSEIKGSAKLEGINFRKSGDYCAVFSNVPALEFNSNNPSYSWTMNKKVIDLTCLGSNGFELAMDKNFSPIIPFGYNAVVVTDSLRYLDNNLLGDLKANKAVLKKNANNELFLLLLSSNCKGFYLIANVFKYNGNSWVRIGDHLELNQSAEIFMEIDPVSNLPILGVQELFNKKILHLVNNRFQEIGLPAALNNKLIKDIKFDRNSYLTILFSGSEPAVYKLINGIFVNVSGNYIKDNIDLVNQSKIFMDKNFDAYIVGLDKNTQQFKILVMRANGWDSLKTCPYNRTFAEADYDLQFDSQNRVCILYRYFNRRNISGILRYNALNQTWEEPFDGIASLYDPYMNFFFDKNDKPYISLTSGSEPGNIRLLQYTTYWDDVPNLKFNKGKTDYLYSYKHKGENYIMFSNITNHVIRFNDDLLSGFNETIKAKSDYLIFPNPATDYLYIKSGLNSNSVTKVRVLNAIGAEVMSIKGVGMDDKIDLRNLSNAWYILEITDKENYISSYKLIINKN